MSTCELIIVNLLETGTAFGVTIPAPGESVFIPGKVADSVKAEVGDRFIALLVPNGIKADRTPWMAVRLDPALPLPLPLPAAAPPPEGLDTRTQVRQIVLAGGVHNVPGVFAHLFPGATRADDLVNYNAVVAELASLYAKGECARFELWRSSDQTKSSRQWFTCRPDLVDLIAREEK